MQVRFGERNLVKGKSTIMNLINVDVEVYLFR